ncbi:UDP-N-acetylglucosamine--N-acetylmuramyl-(pentapeptide) pyrophosphoryl-undecaprenol N-acetylglucosamine transferase [Candidatus Saccharibacteria bacterium]|nr:UDP-N-acetylglucosamine--N-acetylmuramyl-(pentapeptide) pyrophosphoryl-undecaprenol N-acetylglucosamine transferase [Candidatus Saccharibacteria bacterium]
MKILVVGGGSGGHITPAIAVIREILAKKQRARIEFWTDRKYYKNVVKITTLGKEGGDLPIRVRKVWSGKFRRYAGWSFLDYFRNFKITFVDLICKNIVGFFGFLGGIIQSFFRLIDKKERPDVIFLKGGFVGLPVGIVAKMFKIPYVIHESDATPGLANRVLMKKAKVVGMGVKFDKEVPGRENWEWVGIPIGDEFRKVSLPKQISLKRSFGFDTKMPLTVITGGSQGSEHINQVVQQVLPELLKNTSVGLVAGRKHYEQMVELKKFEKWEDAELVSNFRMWEFNSNMDELLGAADIVVSRAGATTIAELSALEKAVILIPFEKLPGGHQVKNAERLEKLGAAMMIRDDEMVEKPEKLVEAVRELVKKPAKRKGIASKLNEEAKLDSAERLAEIIIKVGNEAGRKRIEKESSGRRADFDCEAGLGCGAGLGRGAGKNGGLSGKANRGENRGGKDGRSR